MSNVGDKVSVLGRDGLRTNATIIVGGSCAVRVRHVDGGSSAVTLRDIGAPVSDEQHRAASLARLDRRAAYRV